MWNVTWVNVASGVRGAQELSGGGWLRVYSLL